MCSISCCQYNGRGDVGFWDINNNVKEITCGREVLTSLSDDDVGEGLTVLMVLNIFSCLVWTVQWRVSVMTADSRESGQVTVRHLSLTVGSSDED